MVRFSGAALAVSGVILGAACTPADEPQPQGEERSVTQRVGPEGGVVQLDGLTLTIPAGALPSDVDITIAEASQGGPPNVTLLSPVYRFEPDGTSFDVPVAVTFPLSREDESARVYWSDPQAPTGYWRLFTELEGLFATVATTHFSNAVAATSDCASMRMDDCDGDGECDDSITGLAACGVCGNICPTIPEAPNAGNPRCTLIMPAPDPDLWYLGCSFWCDNGFLDCDGNLSNGCETLEDENNCDGCGRRCEAGENMAQIACVQPELSIGQGRCQIVACREGYADCDGDHANGCERTVAELESDPNNCGSCGYRCANPGTYTAGSCVAGECVHTCAPARLDCVPNRAGEPCLMGDCPVVVSQGCETYKYDSDNCGACGYRCDGAHTVSAICEGAGDVFSDDDDGPPTCVVLSCDDGWLDCSTGPAASDPNVDDGCETPSDEANCGECGRPCEDGAICEYYLGEWRCVPPDAGPNVDAGAVDAGFPDAGPIDAGVDAGALDGGTPLFDAGPLEWPVPPSLTGIAPQAGSNGGGETVTLTGDNLSSLTTVSIDGLPCSDVVCRAQAASGYCTEVSCTTSPKWVTGAKDVVVDNGGMTATLVGGFTYEVPSEYLLLLAANPGDPYTHAFRLRDAAFVSVKRGMIAVEQGPPAVAGSVACARRFEYADGWALEANNCDDSTYVFRPDGSSVYSGGDAMKAAIDPTRQFVAITSYYGVVRLIRAAGSSWLNDKWELFQGPGGDPVMEFGIQTDAGPYDAGPPPDAGWDPTGDAGPLGCLDGPVSARYLRVDFSGVNYLTFADFWVSDESGRIPASAIDQSSEYEATGYWSAEATTDGDTDTCYSTLEDSELAAFIVYDLGTVRTFTSLAFDALHACYFGPVRDFSVGAATDAPAGFVNVVPTTGTAGRASIVGQCP